MAGTKRPYHHGDLRNALISAAVELAVTGGPDAITIRAAARAADVTPPAVYRHFPDREHLLSAAKHKVAQRLTIAMQDCRAPRQMPGSSLCAAARAYICFAVTEPGLFRVISDRTAPEYRPFQVVGGVHLKPEMEIAVWSSVHGLAVLLSDGPLTDLPRAVQDEAIERMIATLTDLSRATD